MTAPAPRENPDLLGQAPAEAAILEAMRTGRMHHAWLLTGPDGVGKATLAYRFARRLFAGLPERDSLAVDPALPVARRVAHGSHADLLTIERAWDEKRKRMRTEIVVDDVRRIGDFLHLTPAEGGWRVVVLDGAEYLNRNAANAVLKVLEEPPARALLLLVCAAPGRLLPTIRSRCRRLRLDPLAAADMQTLLARTLPELAPAERARLADIAEGSPGRALTLAEAGGVRLAGVVDEVLGAAPDVPLLRAYDIADSLSRSDAGFTTFMDLLRAGLARAVREVARGRGDPGQTRMIASRPLDAWGDVWQSLTRLQTETEDLYLDKRQAIVSGIALLNGS